MERIADAQGDLATEEYLELESRLQEKYPNDDGEWLINVVLDAVNNERLFGRYKEFEPMSAALNLRGLPARSTVYLLMIKFSILTLIYRIIRRVDDIQENYIPLACEFFTGVIAEDWGEGLGWVKKENDKWVLDDTPQK